MKSKPYCYFNNRPCDCETQDWCIRDPFRSIDVEDEEIVHLETITGYRDETPEIH